jgi:endonuclease-8
MPEGDTIHKLATALRPRLVGQVLVRARWPRGDARRLAGRRVEAVWALGKHLLMALEGGWVLRSHLGMYGVWHHYAPGEPWRRPQRQAALALWTAREVLVCFNARETELLREDGIRLTNLEHRLGPDLLGEGFDAAGAVTRARELLQPEAPLVDVLLDQRVACGIGNVYKSEVLFLEGHHPLARLSDTPDAVLVALYTTARDLLRRNLGGGPRVTRFADDGLGRLWVYRRKGEPCLRCGERVQALRAGKDLRSTYFCPACQAG